MNKNKKIQSKTLTVPIVKAVLLFASFFFLAFAVGPRLSLEPMQSLWFSLVVILVTIALGYVVRKELESSIKSTLDQPASYSWDHKLANNLFVTLLLAASLFAISFSICSFVCRVIFGAEPEWIYQTSAFLSFIATIVFTGFFLFKIQRNKSKVSRTKNKTDAVKTESKSPE